MGYLGGFLVTLAQVGRRNKVTLEYSGGRENKKGKPQRDEKAPKPERLHGRHVLNRYEDGMEKCIGCELCAGVCHIASLPLRPVDESWLEDFDSCFAGMVYVDGRSTSCSG